MLAPCLLLQAQTGAQPGFSIWPLVFIFGLGYMLIIRPQNRMRKEQDRMRAELKNGDEVLTVGGLYGTVVGLREERIQLRISDGVRVEVARQRIGSLIARDEE